MKEKNKKYILISILISCSFLIYGSSVLATPPCYTLPDYINNFGKYYENVEINQDPCYPSFSFETPISYSSSNIRYIVRYRDIAETEIFAEFDNKIKERINKIENCPDFKRYVELSESSRISINYLLEEYPDFNSCRDITGTLESMENRKIIRDFLSSQEKFGDYNTCVWKEEGSGSVKGFSYSGGKKYGYISFYVLCDGVKESMRLVIENDELKEAYFQNSESEIYREIYPEDIMIRKRSPAWENQDKLTIIIILSSIILLIVIAIVILMTVKRLKKK